MTKDRFQRNLLIIHFTLLAALVGSIPFVARLTPFDRILTDGAWAAPQSSDPIYPMRVAIVLFGLTASIVSMQLTIASLLSAPRNIDRLLVTLALTLTIFSVGWKDFPYWANGVFQGYIHNQGADFDPKALIPMTWIGDAWRFIVIFTYPAAFIGIPVLCFLSLKYSGRLSRASIWLCCIVTAAAFVFCPNYLTWLMD